jgi:ComF family protein
MEQEIVFVQGFRRPVTVLAHVSAVEDIHVFGHARFMTQSGTFINPSVKRLSRRILDLVLPPTCIACGTLVSGVHALCGPCWEKVDFIDDPKCRCCGKPFEDDPGMDALCGICIRKQPIYERARSAVVYGDHSRRFILGYKHGDRTDMVPAMVSWLERAGQELIVDADIIAPVPLHWTRFLARRFNQSAELARELGTRSEICFAPDLLARKKRTVSQAGLNAKERARNVRGAFSVKPAWMDRVEKKRILLIDDVLTTGSTLNACAGILLWAGAGGVDVLTVARVVRAERE